VFCRKKRQDAIRVTKGDEMKELSNALNEIDERNGYGPLGMSKDDLKENARYIHENDRTTKDVSVREKILNKAKDAVCKSRQSTYGDIEDSFDRIAVMWSAYLKGLKDPSELDGRNVAMLMIMLKIARSEHKTDYDDNYVDIAGYAANAAELAITK